MAPPSIPVPRPSKRPRLTDNIHGASELHSPSKAVGQDMKREPSHTPSPPTRTAVTSGVKRFAPIPTNCLRSSPQYQQNRNEWVERCISQILALNLKVEKKLIRDDGLSIDWSSPVPVWSDTLKPQVMDLATAITEAHQINAQQRRRPSRKSSFLDSRPLSATCDQPTSSSSGNDYISDNSPTKRKLPPPPRPSSIRRAIAERFIPSPPVSSHRIPVKHGSLQPPSSTPDSEVTIIERSLSTPNTPSKDIYELSVPESAVELDMMGVTVNYLRRYIQTYDTDRASLASAYSRFASFSYRIHKMPCHEMSSTMTCLRPSPELTKRSRLDIITTLLTLPPLHSLPSPGLAVARLDYDMSYLGAKLGMFVVGRVVLPSRTVVHNFVLQRKEADAQEAAAAGVWSLVANAHQIIVFET